MTQPRKKKAEQPDQAALEAAAAEVLKVAEDRAGTIGADQPGGELIPVDPRRDGDVFRVMDAYDEAQILEELEGRPSDKMVYSFSSGGSLQTGLSYSGVAESVRTLNARGLSQIRVAKDVIPQFREVTEEDEKGETVTYVEALVYAEDAKTGGGEWGLARQSKFQTFRNANRKPELDKFATTKALSKAQRNAMLPLVPMAFRELLIALALQDDARVQHLRVGMGDPQAIVGTAELTDDRANEIRQRCRETYAEIKKVQGGPRAMPPGRFNAKLTRAGQVDHERMEEFHAELVSLLAHLREQEGKGAAA